MNKKTDFSKLELSKKAGTYAYCISTNMSRITEACDELFYNADQMKDLILEIVEPANDTPAKRKFVENIKRKTSVADMVCYAGNAMLYSDGYGLN